MALFGRQKEQFMNDVRRNYGGTIAGTRGVEIDAGLRQYMVGVYNYMALAVAGTGAVSFALASNPALMELIGRGPLKWVAFFALIGIGFIAPRIIYNGSKVAAHGMFWLYAALWGLLIAPMLYAFRMEGASQEIYRAFFMAAAAFGAMSLWGYTTKKGLSGWASFLFMACVGLLIAMVVNVLIFKSALMSLVTSGVVVLVFSAITAYETQMVKSLYREGGAANDRSSIFGAFALYGSFVTLFTHILNILGIMRSE
jgi:hypothetical protein